eukprot:scaffold258447_cov32-Tisochrysis_lutea.AAC.1
MGKGRSIGRETDGMGDGRASRCDMQIVSSHPATISGPGSTPLRAAQRWPLPPHPSPSHHQELTKALSPSPSQAARVPAQSACERGAVKAAVSACDWGTYLCPLQSGVSLGSFPRQVVASHGLRLQHTLGSQSRRPRHELWLSLQKSEGRCCGGIGGHGTGLRRHAWHGRCPKTRAGRGCQCGQCLLSTQGAVPDASNVCDERVYRLEVKHNGGELLAEHGELYSRRRLKTLIDGRVVGVHLCANQRGCLVDLLHIVLDPPCRLGQSSALCG